MEILPLIPLDCCQRGAGPNKPFGSDLRLSLLLTRGNIFAGKPGVRRISSSAQSASEDGGVPSEVCRDDRN
ncbi:hypothetical protein AGIG_G20592 [Arapaima gigas]